MAAAAVQRPGAPPPPQERYQGVQKESAGYRLLAAMGWKEGEGLGASKQGIKSHIKVKKKFENWGVGAVEAQEHAQNWTNGMLDFHRVLSNLSEVVSEHARKRGGASSSSSESEGEGASASSGSESEGEQPAAASGKKRKAGGASASSGGGSSSSSEEEEAAAAAPRRVKAATHIGRFKKREAAKMVKAYSEHDLAAILGADPFAAAAAAVPEVKAQRTASSSGYESDSESSEEEEEEAAKPSSKRGKQQKGKGGKKAAGAPATGAATQQAQQAEPQRPEQQAAAQPPAERQQMIVVRRPMPAACRPAAPPAAKGPRPDWWQVCFHTAQGEAAVGVQPGARAHITVHGFSEQDQTNLYNLAHDKATQGRVGLGRSSMPKKVAGARWEGKKTRIENSDDDEDEEAEGEGGWQRQEGVEVGPAPGGVQLEREEGLVIILPASKRHLLDALPDCTAGQVQAAPGAAGGQQPQAAAAAAQQQQQEGKPSKKAKKAKKAAAAAAEQAAGAAAPAAASGLPAIKWKKAVGAALQASGKGRLKLGKLSKAIAKAQGLAKAQRAAALEGLTAYLQSPGSKFSLEGGVVRPKA